MEEYKRSTGVSRRKFIGSAASVAALSLLPGNLSASLLKLKNPDTTFRGVQIGVIAPFSFRGLPGTADDILGYLLKLGMTSVELMNTPIELFAGAPAAPPRQPAATPAVQTQAAQSPAAQVPAGQAPAGQVQRAPLTPEQQAVQDKYIADLKTWRLSAPIAKFEELRKKYASAGVKINLVKFDSFTAAMTPEEIDYCFTVAKTLGAKAMTTGLTDDNKAKLLGPYADKHKLWVGLHNQIQVIPENLDIMLSYGKYMGLNFDLGHHTAGSDIPLKTIIDRYKDRIVSLHLTDRKVNNGISMPFGEGDTPLKEILQYCAESKFPFGADIDLEYVVPAGSDSVAEVAKCVQFCKAALE